MSKHGVLFRSPLLVLSFPGSCERAEGGVRIARGLRGEVPGVASQEVG